MILYTCRTGRESIPMCRHKTNIEKLYLYVDVHLLGIPYVYMVYMYMQKKWGIFISIYIYIHICNWMQDRQETSTYFYRERQLGQGIPKYPIYHALWLYIYIYIYTCTYTLVHKYNIIYIYIQRERDSLSVILEWGPSIQI